MKTIDAPAADSRALAVSQAFVEHWATGRIDEPRDVIARHDDAAKQLMGMAAFLQGVYLATFSFSGIKDHLSPVVLVPLMLPLLSMVACAATVICTVPTDLNVYRVLKLLNRATDLSTLESEVDGSVKMWCEAIDRIATKKGRWLHRANLSFICASVVTFVLLVSAVMMRH